MSDLISKGALFNALAQAQDKGEIFAIIQDMPTVDAEPVRHGRWGDAALLKSNFMFRNGLHATQRQCTSCHRYSAQLYDYPMVVPEMYQYRFCPHCGAKMDEEARHD